MYSSQALMELAALGVNQPTQENQLCDHKEL